MSIVRTRMGALTSAEMRALLPSRPVILLPLGSHEDQGPHAPMGDYLSAERVAAHIAQPATSQGIPAVVAPVLPFGGADFFASMPGGIACRRRHCVRCWDPRLCSAATGAALVERLTAIGATLVAHVATVADGKHWQAGGFRGGSRHRSQPAQVSVN